MGWLFTQGSTKKDIIQDRIRKQENEHGIWETIAHCLRGNVLWTVRQTTAKRDGVPFHSSRFIECNLLEKSLDNFGWGYKDISEDCGPCYYTCPVGYFDLAPDCFIQNSPYAVKWRKTVREIQSEKKEKSGGLRESFHSAKKEGKTCRIHLTGCNWILDVISLKPLRGVRFGTQYRIPRKRVGIIEVV